MEKGKNKTFFPTYDKHVNSSWIPSHLVLSGKKDILIKKNTLHHVFCFVLNKFTIFYFKTKNEICLYSPKTPRQEESPNIN